MKVQEKKEWLIGLIKNRFITKEGFLAKRYPPTRQTLFDNFDDAVPFLLYFNEEDFLLSQVRTIKKCGYGFVDLCSDRGVIAAREIDEWFGGFYALWTATKDPDVYDILFESLDVVRQKFISGEKLFAAFYPSTQKTLGCYEPWSAGFLETCIEMKTSFPDLLEPAQLIMRDWCRRPYFKSYGLFPYRDYYSPTAASIQKNFLAGRYPHPSNSKAPFYVSEGLLRGLKNINRIARFHLINGWYSQLMKSNSTPAFTLLELYLSTGKKYWLDQLKKWIGAALDNFTDSGRVYREFIPKGNRRKIESIVPAFILVDVLCDCAYFVKELRVYLAKAQEIAEFYWKSRMENGLIPENAGMPFAHIDNQIDFAISLRRLAELLGEDVFLRRSIELTEAALKIHETPQGFATYSGKGVQPVIDPKYNCLALKGIINILTVNDSLYEKHHSLFKDR